MPDSSPNPSDEFDLIYVHGQHDWSELHVVTPSTTLAIHITRIFSDPIVDLIELCKDLACGQASYSARLHDEPGATMIVASVFPSQRHIVRVEFWQHAGWKQEPPDGELLLAIDIKTRQFVGLVYRQLEKVRWLYEEKSYRTNRGNFPHQEFEELEKLLKKDEAR